jgi:ornithine decarboxylase
MAQFRFRSAVTPLRRGAQPRGQAPAGPRPPVDEVVRSLRPSEPVHCIRPEVLRATAERFVASFPGEVLYAVKCNPEPAVLRALRAGGVRRFDCASPGEVRLVRQLFPEASVHYMHPVKSPAAIRQAWAEHGVTDFSLDSDEEIDKVLAETGAAADPDASARLGLFVRLALPKGGAVYDLSGKFGAAPDEAARLLRRARAVAGTVGICFHVGSQCLDPGAYARAIRLAAGVAREAGVTPDVLDVGGGFPVSYPDVTPPPLDDFMAAIGEAFREAGFGPGTRLWCEPGRALVAPGASLVVQVIRRRGDELFVNDGVYGSLSDAGVPGFRFPARLVRPDRAESPSGNPATPRGFSLYGPTCDSADRMEGPFVLPDDVRPGDWIELGQLGAYGGCLRTAFNGFDHARLVEVADGPLLATPGYPHAREPERAPADALRVA